MESKYQLQSCITSSSIIHLRFHEFIQSSGPFNKVSMALFPFFLISFLSSHSHHGQTITRVTLFLTYRIIFVGNISWSFIFFVNFATFNLKCFGALDGTSFEFLFFFKEGLLEFRVFCNEVNGDLRYFSDCVNRGLRILIATRRPSDC